MKNKNFECLIMFFMILLNSLLFSLSASGKDNDIHILKIDEHGLIGEITVPDFELENVKENNDYYRIHVKGWAKTSRVGYSELPFVGYWVQVPQFGNFEIEIMDSDYEKLGNSLICPVTRPLKDENGEPVFKSFGDNYNYEGFYPNRMAYIGKRNIFRGVSVVRVNLYPFQCNPSTGELLYYKKIRFRVKFDQPLLPSVGKIEEAWSPFEALSKNIIINYRGRNSIRKTDEINEDDPGEGSKESLKIEVKQDGVYRITYDDMVNSGISKPWKIEPTSFRLFNSGNELRLNVVAKGRRVKRFLQGSYIEFYGNGLDSEFTDTNVYWLRWNDGGIGMTIVDVDGEVTGESEKVENFFETLHIEENKLAWLNTPGAPIDDYWFWSQLSANEEVENIINVPSPDNVKNSTAMIKIGFRGKSDVSDNPDHHTLFYLNGTLLGDSFWDGDIEHIQEVEFSTELLNDGENRVTVEVPGDTGSIIDILFVNWVEVNYWRKLEAVDDQLTFTISGDGRKQVEVVNLSNSDITIFDITNHLDIKEIKGFSIEPDGEKFKVAFEDTISDEKRYHILVNNKIKKVDNLVLWTSLGLKDTQNGADYIIITDKEFLLEVEPLLQFRKDQGLRVMGVSMDELVNEFNHGIYDPSAIKTFLQYAYENWEQPEPTYVFFVGDANLDYRDYLATGKKNKVPPHLSFTSEVGITPDDNWYVSIDGDDILPDIFPGRIRGESKDVVKEIIDKIISYENSFENPPENVLFVADEGRASFEELNNELANLLPVGYNSEKVFLSSFDDVDNARDEIIASINDGKSIVSYVGHGGVTQWSKSNMFKVSDVENLNNQDVLPFINTLNCINGYFSQPFTYCLAEEFVKAKAKGAIACFSASAAGFTWEHDILSKLVFTSIFDDKNRNFGQITTQAKIDAFGKGITIDSMLSYTLFGDPAGQLKIRD